MTTTTTMMMMMKMMMMIIIIIKNQKYILDEFRVHLCANQVFTRSRLI